MWMGIMIPENSWPNLIAFDRHDKKQQQQQLNRVLENSRNHYADLDFVILFRSSAIKFGMKYYSILYHPLPVSPQNISRNFED